MLQDSLYGIQAATAAGMEAVRYRGGSHYAWVPVSEKPTQSDPTVLEHWSKLYWTNPKLIKRERVDD